MGEGGGGRGGGGNVWEGGPEAKEGPGRQGEYPRKGSGSSGVGELNE